MTCRQLPSSEKFNFNEFAKDGDLCVKANGDVAKPGFSMELPGTTRLLFYVKHKPMGKQGTPWRLHELPIHKAHWLERTKQMTQIDKIMQAHQVTFKLAHSCGKHPNIPHHEFYPSCTNAWQNHVTTKSFEDPGHVPNTVLDTSRIMNHLGRFRKSFCISSDGDITKKLSGLGHDYLFYPTLTPSFFVFVLRCFAQHCPRFQWLSLSFYLNTLW